jgi:hypothetical protein
VTSTARRGSESINATPSGHCTGSRTYQQGRMCGAVGCWTGLSTYPDRQGAVREMGSNVATDCNGHSIPQVANGSVAGSDNYASPTPSVGANRSHQERTMMITTIPHDRRTARRDVGPSTGFKLTTTGLAAHTDVPVSSAFEADTWLFLPPVRPDAGGAVTWGLGFGPHRSALRWSLFRCGDDDGFEDRVVCSHPSPFDAELRRWCTTVVGPSCAQELVGAVGSCRWFYRQYFSDRPDLRRAFRR